MEKVYMIDLDGTMYRGNKIIPSAKKFVDTLMERNEEFFFLTNNAKRTKKQNVEHMKQMGFQGIKEEQFFTSSMAAAIYAKEHYTGRNAYYIGQDGLREALIEQGFFITDNDVDFVFVGLDTKGTYEKYSKALSFLLDHAILIGTNDDRLLAQSDGFSIGNGSIVAMYEYATNQVSPKIGKPHSPILESALKYMKKEKNEVVLVGDNLETDILLGVNCGVETVFVTTGVHTKDDVERLQIYPDCIVDSLEQLL